MKTIPISEEWLELKAITKTTANEWEIPINENGNNAIVIRRSGGPFEALHKIDHSFASKTLYYTEEIERMYKALTGRNL